MEMDLFQRLPTEMQREIISHLPMKSILTARCVSKQWKDMISQNFTNFICHINDESYSCVGNSTETFRTVKIFDLTSKENKVVSSSRGAGRVINNVETVELIGDNIDLDELKKIMRYAMDIQGLLFQRCRVPILMTVLGSPLGHFQNLTNLSFQFKGPPSGEQTQFLNKLAAVGSNSLKVLEHLSFSWTCRYGDPQMGFSRGRAGKIFANYLATICLITSVRRTLKSLEISRSPRVMITLQIGLRQFTTNNVFERVLMNKYIQELGELKLNTLKLTLMMVEGKDPWILENVLMRSQSSVKNLTLNKKCISNRSFLPQTLENLLPVDPTQLTTINISMTIQGNDPINLGYFSQCSHLKSLWLSSHCYLFSPENEWTCSVSQLTQLPRKLQSLRLVPQRNILDEDDYNYGDPHYLNFYRESYMILTRNQLEWITKNLLELTFFASFLVVAETEGEIMVNREQIRPPAAGGFNGIANVDLDLFKTLVELPTVKSLELSMLKAGQIRGFDERVRRELFSTVRSTNEIRQYINYCQQHRSITILKTKVIPQKYVEMTITK